nr:CBS domain-containing protein [Kofleriaceae bacterium]
MTVWPEDEVTKRICAVGDLVECAVAVVEPATPIDDVSMLLVELRIPAVCVVGSDGGLLGVVTRTDALRAEPGSTADVAMSTYLLALPACATIGRAAALMAVEHVGHVAVVHDDGSLLGLVSAVDIARYFAAEAGFVV